MTKGENSILFYKEPIPSDSQSASLLQQEQIADGVLSQKEVSSDLVDVVSKVGHLKDVEESFFFAKAAEDHESENNRDRIFCGMV